VRSPLPALVAVCAVLAAGLSGCAAEPPRTAPTATPAPQPAASGDGVLRIGTLFSSTGAFAAYSPAQVAGVELAVRDANAAGGVDGHPVEVFHRNAADGGAPAAAAFAALREKRVDVVIGPASTPVAESILGEAAIRDVLVIAPGFVDAKRAAELVPAGLFRTVADPGTPTRADDEFLARLSVTDPGLEDTTFAAEAYDATIAAVLAAVAAADDGAASLAWALPAVTTAGYGCTVLGVCLEAMAASEDVDYGGVSGPVDVLTPAAAVSGPAPEADVSAAEH
jgi:ABC-type branched-subunit amino acid transport system substrate-binding protein